MGATAAAAADLTAGNGIGAETDLKLSTALGGSTGAIAYAAKDDAKAIAEKIKSYLKQL